MLKLTCAALAAAFLLSAAPVAAQASENPWKPGDVWTVSSIRVKEGHNLTYAKYLADTWQGLQENAKAKGWIKSYHVLSNPQRRNDEPDIYLITIATDLPTGAQQDARAEEQRAFMKMTNTQLQASAGQRAEYRTGLGNIVLRELVRR